MESKNCKVCDIKFITDNKKQMFCNKQCSKHFFNKKNRITTHQWGSLKNKKIAATEENKINYKQLLNSHYTRNELKSTSINTVTMERFFKIFNIDCNVKLLNIVYFNDIWSGGVTKFYDKNSCNIYKQFVLTKEVDGYRNDHYIIKKLNISKNTFKNYKNNKFSGLKDPIIFWGCSFYEQKETDAWIDNIVLFKLKNAELKNCFRQEDQKRKNQQRLDLEIKKQEKKRLSEIKKQEKKILKNKIKEQLKIQKQLNKLNAPKKKYKLSIPLRKDDWTDWQNYEARLKQRLSDPVEVAKMRLDSAVENNKFYYAQHDIGNIISLMCKTCKNSKPYYEFHFDQTCKAGRRTKTCKVCTNIRANKHNKTRSKTKSANQFVIQFIISIKRELSKKNNQYYEISAKKIWDALPYTKEQFLEHVKSLMESWMTWENNTRPRVGEKTWHLDHVIPKASFNYKSINDQEFTDCWSLSNLRPIEAEVNIIKGDHKSLNSLVSSLFKSVVVRKKDIKVWNKYFNYMADEARSHLESQFVNGMNWSNFGKVWHIDHIIPKAALPYETFDDENYKKLWSLSNLRPLLVSDNCSKGSKYENKKYYVTNTI